MAKKNVTYVSYSLFIDLANASGAKTTEQAGFTRVEFGSGHRLYVARTKSVGRVDVSCFVPTVAGVRVLSEGEKFGNVLAQVDFARTQDEILKTFADLLTEMKTLPKLEKAPRKQMAPKAPKAAEPVAVDPKAARLEKLKNRAGLLQAVKHIPLNEAIEQAQAEQEEAGEEQA